MLRSRLAVTAAALALITVPLSAALPAQAASTPTNVTSAAKKLAHDDHAKKSKVKAYKKALKPLAKQCAEGYSIWFSIDIDAQTAHMNRLKSMKAVDKKLGKATKVDCTDAFLDYDSKTPIVIAKQTTAAEPYILGTASTKKPYPACSDAAANWTATEGPIWVTILNTPGVAKITVKLTANGKAYTLKHTIPGGEDTHIFVFKKADPTKVTQVVATATGNDNEKSGSCIVTGSPTN